MAEALGRFGYVAVALFMLAEGVGIPLPAETMLVIAGVFAARGKLSIWGVVLAGAVGGMVGGPAGYALGSMGGLRLIRRYGSRFGIDEEKLTRARDFFRARGSSAAFLGRFVAFLRMIVPMVAGIAHMPFARFSAYNAGGSVAASAAYGFLWLSVRAGSSGAEASPHESGGGGGGRGGGSRAVVATAGSRDSLDQPGRVTLRSRREGSLVRPLQPEPICYPSPPARSRSCSS